jgi:hypothetical protein
MRTRLKCPEAPSTVMLERSATTFVPALIWRAVW